MHEILSLAMEILHFQIFFQREYDQIDIKVMLMHEIKRLQAERVEANRNVSFFKEGTEILNRYAMYCN